MPGSFRFFLSALPLLAALLGLFGCSASTRGPRPGTPVVGGSSPGAEKNPPFPVMLGIDVLESQGFAAVKGKRIGLLTHPAGVNRRGVSTIEVLRHAPGVTLVALFAVEHGINGEFPASNNYDDYVDQRTGLKVFSLYNGRTKRPTKAQLQGLDALVIDLQDIGVRSYTFAAWMKYAIEGCFEHGVEVIVLDRPNPLGGLKVSGPPLDPELKSDVGAYRVPYVHGLTIGELARMAAQAPAVLEVSEEVRAGGRLTIVPMRGWRRTMRWPDTGLTFVPTSPLVQNYDAVVGYAMVGLGCELSGFTSGIGKSYPFRGVAYKGRTLDQLEKDFNELHVPGLQFRRVLAPDAAGRMVPGLYVDVSDWNAWDPTELSFQMMRLACRLNPLNPFTRLNPVEVRQFNIHVGSTAWWFALRRDGARVNVEAFLKDWRERDQIYQDQTRKYWLYN